jgi:regulation of enolase protein 1 (concanavalin A-like superfamily)/SH3-like domain-containing protein
MRFTAKGSTAYHLWIRMRAQSDSTNGDSIHAQFSDSVNAVGQPIIRIGSTSSAEVVLQNGPTGSAPLGWGWTDNGWGSLGAPVYFEADGEHIVRIQQREDGAVVDQIVLSPITFATSAPGARQSDTRIMPRAWDLGANVSALTSVIRVAAAAAGRTFGSWQIISDPTAAASQAERNPNADAAKIAPALSNPASYFEATFTAEGGRPYHVWVRMRADGNLASNDSVHVQFNDSVTSSSSPIAQIGTNSSLEIVLQDGSNGSAPHGWGWTENGWGSLGVHVYFATTGTHTIRVQQREDGAIIDQIVISPDTFLTSPPGWRLDDITILQASGTSPPSSPNNLPPTVMLTAPTNGATFTAPATITLTATASDPEGRLTKVDFYNGATLLGSDTTAPYSYSWGNVAAGSYSVRAIAVDGSGASATSAIATVTVAASTAAPLPNGQQHQDIGAPAVAGSAAYSNGTYTVSGAGVDVWNSSQELWNTSDQFHYVYQQMSGDFEIVARIVSLQGGNAWSKAGLMVRESLADNSRHAMAHVTGGIGYRMLSRTMTGGTTVAQGCVSGTTPGWIRLIRRGTTFEMMQSPTGTSWTSCVTTQVSMVSTVYVGLAVGNVDVTGLATAVFDNVSIISQGTGNQPPTVNLTAPATGATFTAPATITLTATASDPEGRLTRVDFYNGATLLGSDTSAPFSFLWSSIAAGTYQLRAVATDADGGSASSTIATVTVGTATTTTSTTKRVAFTASIDHAIVTRYLLEVFPATANPATATAMTSSDLGKPTPDGSNQIIVDRTTFLNNLASGNYLVTVAAVGAGGASRSTAISFTR